MGIRCDDWLNVKSEIHYFFSTLRGIKWHGGGVVSVLLLFVRPNFSLVVCLLGYLLGYLVCWQAV